MAMSDAILTRLLTLHPKIIDLELDRMWRILDRLGNPEARLPPVIHIAGTNGKGSTLAYLRAILEAAGLKVHCYTSPHLVKFHERIRVAGGAHRRSRTQRACSRNAKRPMRASPSPSSRSPPRRPFSPSRATRPTILCLRWAWAAGSMPPM